MRSNEERVELIRQRLRDGLGARTVEVEDDSHKHIGHAGARDGRGHFNVTVVSDAFENKSLVERHRMVYEAVGDLMDTDIHALSIQARTPAEAMAG